MLLSYLPVLIMVVFVSLVVFAVLFVSSLLRPKNPYPAKLKPWECGLEPIGEANRGQVRIHFFIVAILFIIFDLEIAFLFPWAIVLDEIGLFGILAMGIFLGVLVIGFIYEWKKGALEWE